MTAAEVSWPPDDGLGLGPRARWSRAPVRSQHRATRTAVELVASDPPAAPDVTLGSDPADGWHLYQLCSVGSLLVAGSPLQGRMVLSGSTKLGSWMDAHGKIWASRFWKCFLSLCLRQRHENYFLNNVIFQIVKDVTVFMIVDCRIREPLAIWRWLGMKLTKTELGVRTPGWVSHLLGDLGQVRGPSWASVSLCETRILNTQDFCSTDILENVTFHTPLTDTFDRHCLPNS